nr:hypothetical protein [Candidatus Microthrix sp.]
MPIESCGLLRTTSSLPPLLLSSRHYRGFMRPAAALRGLVDLVADIVAEPGGER